MSALGYLLVGAIVFALWFSLEPWLAAQRTRWRQNAKERREALDALQGSTILLADDSVTIQKVVELTFMDQSVHLVGVSSGEAAMSLLKERRFDLVIADVYIPASHKYADAHILASNGYEVCEYAKRLYPKIPVILLAGAFEPFDEELYEGCGADEFLKKPFDSQNLVLIAGRLLKGR